MFEFFKKLKKQSKLHELVRASEVVVSGDAVDDFFTQSVLMLRGHTAIHPYIESIVSIYQLFNNKTKKFCHSKELYVGHESDYFLVNVIFKMHDGDVMLTLFMGENRSVEAQAFCINAILQSYEGYKLSDIAFNQEKLPEPAKSIANGMTYPGNDLSQLRLKKIDCFDGKEIYIHQLNIRNGPVEGIVAIGGFTVQSA